MAQLIVNSRLQLRKQRLLSKKLRKIKNNNILSLRQLYPKEWLNLKDKKEMKKRSMRT